MKKSGLCWWSVAFCWLLLGAATATQAQENQEQKNKWSVGVKGGATLPSVISSNNQLQIGNFDSAPQLLRSTGGVSVQYLTEKNFGLQVEFNYTQRGWEERPRDALTNERTATRFYRVNLDYAEVPVLAHGYFGKRNLRLFLNAGVYLAYLLDGDTERANVLDENVTLFYEEQIQNTTDFGVRGGGGVEVVTKVGMFQAEGSYSFGLNSVMDKNVQQIPHIVQNSTTAITLGYYVQF